MTYLTDSTLSKFPEEENFEPIILSQFLDFIVDYAFKNSLSFEPYMEEMAAEDDEILKSVLIEL